MDCSVGLLAIGVADSQQNIILSLGRGAEGEKRIGRDLLSVDLPRVGGSSKTLDNGLKPERATKSDVARGGDMDRSLGVLNDVERERLLVAAILILGAQRLFLSRQYLAKMLPLSKHLSV